MARNRPDVSNTLKKRLRANAGNKCANPGCSSERTHVHHIREWAVYETHDSKHMIAVCPTCHDAIHHGDLPISDETVYGWKQLPRTDGIARTHVYVEPGQSTKILLGTIAVSASDPVVVFKLAQNNRLSFRVADREILLVSLAVQALDGSELLRVTDNHVRHARQSPVAFHQVPGRVQLTVPPIDEFIPEWVVRLMRKQELKFATSAELTLLDMEVLEPGLLRVQGAWLDADRAVIVTKERLSFIHPQMVQPLSMVGDGAGSVLQWAGPINGQMFGFQ